MRICLFGSDARGDAGPDCDLDFPFVLPDDAPVEKSRTGAGREGFWLRKAPKKSSATVTAENATSLRFVVANRSGTTAFRPRMSPIEMSVSSKQPLTTRAGLHEGDCAALSKSSGIRPQAAMTTGRPRLPAAAVE